MYKINLLFECLRGNLNQFNRASFGIGIGQKPPMIERDAVNLTLSVRIPHRRINLCFGQRQQGAG